MRLFMKFFGGGAYPFLLENGLHVDTNAWLTRVATNGGTVPASQINAVNAMVLAINARGLRAGCKRFNPMVGDAAAMAVPVYNDWGAVKDTIADSPTINVNGLDTGNSTTKYIDTGINPSSQVGWDSQNSHLGIWLSDGNLIDSNKAIAGVYSNAGTLRYGVMWNVNGSIVASFGITAENLTRNARTLGVLSGHLLMYAKTGVTNLWQNGASVITTGTNPTNGKPNSTLRIGQINNGAMLASGIHGGYHLGMSLTTQNAADWSEIMTMGALLGNRQPGWIAVGDSLTSSGTWNTLLQSGTYPRTEVAYSATGGISSATALNNVTAAIAANPSLKWHNAIVWLGQNDSGVGGWDGSNTIANVTSILAKFPHQRFRVIDMIYKNLPAEYIGQPKRIVKDFVSATWATMYGAKKRGITSILVNGGTGVGQDAIDLANGVTPSSLHKRLSAYAISAITNAANGAFTCAAHPFVIGDCVDLAAITGMTELNGVTAQVVTVPDNTHFTINIDTTAFTPYVSGGTATLVDSIHINPTGDALIAADLAAATSGGW